MCVCVCARACVRVCVCVCVCVWTEDGLRRGREVGVDRKQGGADECGGGGKGQKRREEIKRILNIEIHTAHIYMLICIYSVETMAKFSARGHHRQNPTHSYDLANIL